MVILFIAIHLFLLHLVPGHHFFALLPERACNGPIILEIHFHGLGFVIDLTQDPIFPGFPIHKGHQAPGTLGWRNRHQIFEGRVVGIVQEMISCMATITMQFANF